MSSSGVNVFSKQARFQDLGPIPTNRGGGTCKGGQPHRVSFYRRFSDWKFMSNSDVNVFSKQERFHDLGPIPSNRGDL